MRNLIIVSRAVGLLFLLHQQTAVAQSNHTSNGSNRVSYGATSRGNFGPRGRPSSVDGGFWPSGTYNQYMWNSGPQIAGIIGGASGTNPWAGDTTGAMFFDPSGTRQHSAYVIPAFNSNPGFDSFNNLPPNDLENWPSAGLIPATGILSELFNPLFFGQKAISDGDIWFVATEADPGLNAARSHPLGVVAEFRVMGWNAPRGNEDILYVVTTFYNITSTEPADYANYSAATRELLLEEAEKFQQRNEAEFGIQLPDGGYPIENFHSAVSADPDVTSDAGNNFSSVSMPFEMGFAWNPDFGRASGWTFNPEIFGSPFFPGSGLVGTAFLGSNQTGRGIQLFSEVTNGGVFPDPNSGQRLFRYLSGALSSEESSLCNNGAHLSSGICYIDTTRPTDVRYFQSTPGVTLPAGGSTTMSWVYVHAAPVAIPGFVQGTSVGPGGPTRMSNAGLLSLGANTIDSIAGFTGFVDSNGDGVVQPHEISTVRRSLLHKAQLAQAVYDNKFLMPQAPEAPDFFLVPGDLGVTVVWRPSDSETTGDPFHSVASNASVVPTGGGLPIPNVLFDPNFRQFDVEGYRIYRSRISNPESMELMAQFDYSGTVFNDFSATVVGLAIGTRCAPEIGVVESCDGMFDMPSPGEAPTKSIEHDLSGELVQVRNGDRVELANGLIAVLNADTLITGAGSGHPSLGNTGVPFVWIDEATINGVEYFYTVVAFDVNSIASTGIGRTSNESVRVVKRVTTTRTSVNSSYSASFTVGVAGRNGFLTDTLMPTLDPLTGKFSKPFPPTNATTLSVVSIVKEVLNGSGEVNVTLDSIKTVAYSDASRTNSVHHFTVSGPLGVTKLSLPVEISSQDDSPAPIAATLPGLMVDPVLAAAYGEAHGEEFTVPVGFTLSFTPGYYTGVKSRGCVNGSGAAGFSSSYPLCDANGPRWWQGTDQSALKDNPNAANNARFRTGALRTDFNNVGGPLTGVRTIFRPMAYNDMSSNFRDVEAVLSPFMGAADYRVYWGQGGTIDSVIDIVHDVEVPFDDQLGPSWGILNQSGTNTGAVYHDQRSELTISDIGCLEPIRTLNPGNIACTGAGAAMERTAKPGPIAYSSTNNSAAAVRNPPPAAGQGFLLYLKGQTFVVELVGGVPTAGTIWTMRDYVGAIGGGLQAAGDGGPMSYFATWFPRPFAAVGASIRLKYVITNELGNPNQETLDRIHPVPDPWYRAVADGEASVSLVNLPPVATVRFYTTSGVLVRVLEHNSPIRSSELTWDLRSREGLEVASGVYFYHVTAENGATVVGRMTIVR